MFLTIFSILCAVQTIFHHNSIFSLPFVSALRFLYDSLNSFVLEFERRLLIKFLSSSFGIAFETSYYPQTQRLL